MLFFSQMKEMRTLLCGSSDTLQAVLLNGMMRGNDVLVVPMALKAFEIFAFYRNIILRQGYREYYALQFQNNTILYAAVQIFSLPLDIVENFWYDIEVRMIL